MPMDSDNRTSVCFLLPETPADCSCARLSLACDVGFGDGLRMPILSPWPSVIGGRPRQALPVGAPLQFDSGSVFEQSLITAVYLKAV